MKRRDIVGQKFGRLLVVERAPDLNGHSRWKCECDCGNTCVILQSSLLKSKGATRSCGCLAREAVLKFNASRSDIHAGDRFGRLVVVERVTPDRLPDSNAKRAKWKCVCDCGAHVFVYGGNLRKGCSQSCGCLQKEKLSERVKTHGGWANNEPLYIVWLGIRHRCNIETDVHYPNYGGRGITYCEEWEDYAVFRDWAYSHGYKPDSGLSIDRIDVNGNYCPENCRWVTSKVQQNNRRCNIVYEIDGKEMTLKQIAEKFNINYQTLHGRVRRRGWSIEKAISVP